MGRHSHETGRCADNDQTDSSQKTGIVLPRQGIFVSAIENLGRQLILVNFGKVGLEYLFPNEILVRNRGVNESLAVP